jgi:general stress protein 26
MPQYPVRGFIKEEAAMAIDEAMATRAKEIMRKSTFTSFATVDENGCPQMRAMMPAAIEDDFTVYYITSRLTAKCRQIAANSKVSSLWSEVIEPMANWRSVLIKGEALVTDDKALRDRFWMDQLKPFFPGGADDPNFVILVCKPVEMILADAQTMQPMVVKM